MTCDMCLGEGTGAVAFLPVLDMALAVYEKMSTFSDIHIDDYEELGDKQNIQRKSGDKMMMHVITGGSGSGKSAYAEMWLTGKPEKSEEKKAICPYTESKTSVTRMNPSDSLYRYVGIENAKRMRSYGMCLEEYKSYLQKQAIPK